MKERWVSRGALAVALTLAVAAGYALVARDGGPSTVRGADASLSGRPKPPESVKRKLALMNKLLTSLIERLEQELDPKSEEALNLLSRSRTSSTRSAWTSTRRGRALPRG